ncbi:MAG: ImmA/IrrE family metallo-endopeptidase [Acidobacteriota bacterium]|nr:ImmA/IrrE family metallo-endopeptidase [Blastocatellia bacterium]MDW8411717.1 ImmA/IrrE family metallo-endopeptidase [Acidobacteriota bacterium]
MSLNPSVIFGLKLKKFREMRGLTITEFAALCELSPMYLTELEKGSKYPKPDKIHRIAKALGRSYEDLISPKLTEEFAPLEDFLNSPILANFPFHLFGISLKDLVDMLTRSPAQVSALLKALLNIAESHHLQLEDLFRVALRAYQESKLNYFEDIEDAVEELIRNYGPNSSLEHLNKLLRELYDYKIDFEHLSRYPELLIYRSVYLDLSSPRLLVNPALSLPQKRFVLARELGYQFLGLKERAWTFVPEQASSFEQVLNDFKASYFAGALLINKEQILADLKRLFEMPNWDYRELLALVEKYDATPEMLFYRISELVPTFLGLKLHFLRYNFEEGQIRLVKQLNTAHFTVGLSMSEHHCRRWAVLRYLKKLAREVGKKGRYIFAGAQLSKFVDSEKQFLCLSIASSSPLRQGTLSSVAIGLYQDESLERQVKFLADKTIPRIQVGTSCERCPLRDCQERAAEATVLLNLEQRRKRINLLKLLRQE